MQHAMFFPNLCLEKVAPAGHYPMSGSDGYWTFDINDNMLSLRMP